MLEQALDLAEEQEYDEAILIYNKILKINPNNMNAIIDKATTLQRLGKNSLALTLSIDFLSINSGLSPKILYKDTHFITACLLE